MKLALVLLLLFILPLKAQVDFDKVEVELYTFGVGVNYWEAFGHSALRVKTDNNDYMYGFGYFNFNDEDFFLKFAKGEMQYFLGIELSNVEMDGYIGQGRAIWSQKLNLTSSQKKQLIDKLNFLAQEENRYYHYDYFLNNCTSKIRDLLDEVTNGDISKQLKGVKTNKSWSDLTFPVKNQTWMNLGIAIAYGVPAYLSRDKLQLSVFPLDFAKDIEGLDTPSHWNGSLTQINKAKSLLLEYSFTKTHYAAIIVVTLILLGLMLPSTCYKITTYTWLTMQSLIGLGLVFLWFFSEHSVASWNINLLLFSPLAFLLLKRQWKKPLLTAFLLQNLLWILLAFIFTNFYLIGFSFINFVIYYKERLCKANNRGGPIL